MVICFYGGGTVQSQESREGVPMYPPPFSASSITNDKYVQKQHDKKSSNTVEMNRIRNDKV